MKDWAKGFSKANHGVNGWLPRIAWVCACAFCFSSALAQTDSDIREKIHQLEELRSAGKFQEAVPLAEEVPSIARNMTGPTTRKQPPA